LEVLPTGEAAWKSSFFSLAGTPFADSDIHETGFACEAARSMILIFKGYRSRGFPIFAGFWGISVLRSHRNFRNTFIISWGLNASDLQLPVEGRFSRVRVDDNGGSEMWIRVKSIHCVSTRAGELTEEPFFIVRRFPEDEMSETWGPFSIRNGQTILLNRFIRNPPGNTVDITLFDSDKPGHRGGGPHDDLLGDIRVGSSDARGSFNAIFPHYEGMHGGGSRQREYIVYYDVFDDEHDLPVKPYLLQLVSLHCRDAQERKDKVFITVDGERVLEPRDMKTGDILPLVNTVDPIPIGSTATIELWELDNYRNDKFGSYTLAIRSGFNFDRPLDPIRFHRDKGIRGDATYNLYYRVTPSS